MSDSSVNLFGWDLLYRSVQAEVESNADILICFAHLVLVRQGFKCIGIGDSTVLVGDENKSEAIPPGWRDTYALRYVYQGRLYNFKATVLDDGIMINLIRPDERSVSMVHLYSNTVVQKTGDIDAMIPTYQEMVKSIKSDLIDKVTVSKKTKEQTSQTETRATTSDAATERFLDNVYVPPFGGGGFIPAGGAGGFGGSFRDPFGVRGIGGADLDPLGGMGLPPFHRPPGGGIIPPGGGGMLYVPPRNPAGGGGQPNLGVPGGSIPPGARFDPFRPPEAERFPAPPRRPNMPDNDEFAPPGFDDMYM